jgi:signal transduction histidine kinase
MRIYIIQYVSISILLLLAAKVSGQKSVHDYYKISNKKFNEGKYIESLNTCIEALKFAESSNNCSAIAYAHLKVGNMHYYLKDRRQALKSYFLCLQSLDTCAFDTLRHTAFNNIGAVYSELQKVDSALIYLGNALSLLRKTKRYEELARVNSVMADLYISIKNLDKAEQFIRDAEHYSELSGDIKQKTFAKIKRGALARSRKKYDDALRLYKEALETYETIAYTEGRLHMLKSVADVMALSQNSEALIYYNKLLVLKDSIFKIETAAKIAEYETLYKIHKKETENKFLQNENNLKQAEIESRNKTIAGLMIGVLLIIIFALWRITVINLRKKKQELNAAKNLQKEKERISRDLHDNVGGQLSYVLYSIDGILDDDRNKRSELSSNISNSIKSVISNLRETIWAINDESVSVTDLSDKLKLYARNLFRNSSTTVVFNENLQPDSFLPSMTGLNLYRISQEIMNNAFKYANASELNISINHTDALIKITIQDNGEGFDQNTTSDGYGIKNIKSRAAESDITLDFHTEKGTGTHYTLMVRMH